jgi:hypothetical protein
LFIISFVVVEAQPDTGGGVCGHCGARALARAGKDGIESILEVGTKTTRGDH